MLERNTTLTGRTELWEEIFKMTNNPVFGSGFESFWLGSRIEHLWHIFWWRPTQAHNGYIEIFINLGCIGIVLLTLLVINGYTKAVAAVFRGEGAASLRLAYIIIAIPYNFTEAAFRMQNLPWIFLLLGVIGIQSRGKQKLYGDDFKASRRRHTPLQLVPSEPRVSNSV
jgi:O-antigen ligase